MVEEERERSYLECSLWDFRCVSGSFRSSGDQKMEYENKTNTTQTEPHLIKLPIGHDKDLSGP